MAPFPAREREFYLSKIVHTDSKTIKYPTRWVPGSLSRVKRQEDEAIAQFKNDRIYICILAYELMARPRTTLPRYIIIIITLKDT